MPQFKVRDLMINVVPESVQPYEDCGWTCMYSCEFTGGGGGCGPTCGPTCYNVSHCNRLATHLPNIMAPIGSQNLAAVKAQLQEALRNVEIQQQAAEASLQPQSLAEVEMLEQKLTEALNELKARKTVLQQQATKDQGTP
jgi:hypothetical protein